MSIKQRYEQGQKYYEKALKSEHPDPLLYAIAAMLEFKPKKKSTSLNLEVNATHVSTALADCPNFALSAARGSDYGRLNKVLADLSPRIDTEGLYNLRCWIANGGLSWWTTGAITMTSVIRHLPNWWAQVQGQPSQTTQGTMLR